MIKRLLFMLPVIIFSLAAAAQKINTETDSTTGKLPDGVYFKGSNLFIEKGFKATHLKEENVVIIQKMKPGGGLGSTSGVFQCQCPGGTGCEALIGDDRLQCVPNGCENVCRIYTMTGKPGKDLAMTIKTARQNKKSIKWKAVVFPQVRN